MALIGNIFCFVVSIAMVATFINIESVIKALFLMKICCEGI